MTRPGSEPSQPVWVARAEATNHAIQPVKHVEKKTYSDKRFFGLDFMDNSNTNERRGGDAF